MAAVVDWSPLWTVWLATNAQLDAEAPVRKLEEELRIEKEVWLFTILPDSG